MAVIIFIAKIYIPFIFSLLLVYIAIKHDFNQNSIFTVNVFGLDIEITNKIIGKMACSAFALSIIPYYLTINYCQFFPKDLQMEVFYDHSGIKKSLEQFTPEELSSFNYDKSNDKYAEIYYKDLDVKLKYLLKYDGFFSLSDGIVHSSGETKFEVSQESGFHNYHIEKAEGKLSHLLERPQHKPIEFRSFFEKLPSINDYIRPSFSEIVFKQEVILKPLFKQVVAEKLKSDGIIFDHTLMGVTKVKLLPFPKYFNTVYFFEYTNKVSVPIGYAVYR